MPLNCVRGFPENEVRVDIPKSHIHRQNESDKGLTSHNKVTLRNIFMFVMKINKISILKFSE